MFENKIRKYLSGVIVVSLLSLSLGLTAFAASFGNDSCGASSEEVLQIRYDGAAWNYTGSEYSWASFTYTRGDRTLMHKCVDEGKVTGSVWDDLRWGDKYTTRFSWNRG